MTNTLLYATAKTLKVNDVVLFRNKMKQPKEDKIQSARIADVGITDVGVIHLTYVPCNRGDSVQCGFGCHFIKDSNGDSANKLGEWGWQALSIVSL